MGSVSENTVIYLDNAATTRPDSITMDNVVFANTHWWMNPSSRYDGGMEVRRVLEEARSRVAKLINAESEEIYFCSSGTEANNLVINGIVIALANECSDLHFDVSFHRCKAEHPSVRNINTCAHEVGIKYDSVNHEYKFSERYFKHSLVSMMMANNETGLINDVKGLAELVHKEGGYIHTDATAYIPHRRVDVKDLDVDALTFSGHKLGIPRGVGVMYIKKGTPYTPVLYGGHQENGVRPGTENTALIYALGSYADELTNDTFSDFILYDEFSTTESYYENLFMTALDKATKDLCEYKMNRIEDKEYLPSTISVTFKGISALMLMTLLNERNVYCSTGSACSSGDEAASETLLFYGISEEDARSTLRFSLSYWENDKYQIEEFGRRLRRCLQDIKMLGFTSDRKG